MLAQASADSCSLKQHGTLLAAQTSVKVRLTRTLADAIDGIDLGQCHVGDIVDLPPREACLLLAEAWAVPEQGPNMQSAQTDLADSRHSAR